MLYAESELKLLPDAKLKENIFDTPAMAATRDGFGKALAWSLAKKSKRGGAVRRLGREHARLGV
jgi:hypothetical protein